MNAADSTSQSAVRTVSLLLGLLLLSPAAIAAQRAVLNHVTVRVQVDGEPTARVARVAAEYLVEVDTSTAALAISGLAFLGAVPTDVRASVDGLSAPITLQPTGYRRLAGAVALPGRQEREIRLRINYRVAASADVPSYRMAVPLLVPDAVPASASDDFFTASLRLPADHFVTEAFPTLPPRRIEGENEVWELSLQVVPAVLEWRAHIGDAPLVRFGRLVDAGALVVLLVTGVVVVRVLVRQQGNSGT